MYKGSVAAMAVKIMRIAGRLTQEEVARRINMDRSVISLAEAGKKLNAELVINLLEGCGGVEMLDWLIEQLQTVREWFSINRRTGHLLYA